MKVTFQIQGQSPVTVACAPGENLLELARRANVALDAPCSGSGVCGKCRVRLLEGELQCPQNRHLSPEEFAQGWRLSCESTVRSDCTVLVPDTASAYRSRIKTADLSAPREIEVFRTIQKELQQAGIAFTNPYRALVLALPVPSLEDTAADGQRLTAAIRESLGVKQVSLPYSVMVELSAALRRNDFRICVKGALEDDRFTCMAVCGPEDTAMAVCAMDIGTTTVTMVLADPVTGQILAKGSSGNGQIRYGADVINRIIQQGRPGGRQTLRSAILEDTVQPLIRSLCATAGITPNSVLRLSVAANTTMNHLMLGVDAAPVRMEPYIPSFFHWEGLTAGDLNLPVNPTAPVILAPNIGSYVGGDITAGTLASGIWNRDEMALLIDLGTNGELVFGNRDFLMSCACSAGPAFEGGDIRCGMRATDGAVEACTIDPDTLEPTLGIIGPPGQKCVGICGSGIIDIVAQLYRLGIINARGAFVRSGRRIRYDDHGAGRYVLAFPGESETGREVFIHEVDIDNFIRAKGAVYSAIDTLLSAVDLEPDCIDRVYVAGGIGSGIHIQNAISIGMLPNLPPETYRYIGNSALAGAYALAMSLPAEKTCRAVAENMTYLELSTYPGYMDAFVAACFIPHTDSRRFSGV